MSKGILLPSRQKLKTLYLLEMSPKVDCNCVNRYLSASLGLLGEKVARHPFLFFSIPLLCNAILAIGFTKISFASEVEYLYCPINGRAMSERRAVESLFPSNHSDFDFLRETRMTRLSGAIVEPIDRGSALRKSIIEFSQKVDNAAKNISIQWKNRTIRYRDICPKTPSGECYVNEILSLKGRIKEIKKKQLCIGYPIDLNERASYRVSVSNLGGVALDEEDCIKDAKAIRLLYFLEYSTPEMNEISVIWETEFVKTLKNLHSDHAYVHVFVGSMFNSEFHRVTEMVVPLTFIAGPLIAGFAIFTCLTRDWVTSKPWIGVAGCLTSCLGTLGAFGLLLLCGMEYTDVNVALPFLMTGVGLDDSFVILAAWRRTNPTDPVERRLADSYSEAAVSVTITSLTNFLSFCIGMTTPYNVIRIFSLYAAVSIVFCYVFQLTFFGASLTLAGWREHSGRHSVLCIKVKPEKEPKSTILRLIYFGLRRKEDIDVGGGPSFYGDILGRTLTKPYAKAIVFLTFIAYLAGAIFGITYLRQGFEYTNGFPYDSYAINSSLKHYQYFAHYPHSISIVVNATLDYSNPEVQKDIKYIIAKFTSAPYMAGDVVDSWLKYYLDSIHDKRFWLSYRGYNMSNPKDFIHALQNVFLRIPSFHRFNGDIVFNENKTEIVASRYIVSSKDVLNSEMERKLILTLWNTADSCKYKVYVHNFWFIIYNQHTDILSTSVQSLCTAVTIITVVFIIFIPNIVCAICVAITILSVQIGIIGYMSLWGVSLDTISTVNLLMAAGFSVDYAAHVSYAYVACKQTHPDDKLKKSLEAAGHPIIQGCVSTILGVAALWVGPSYVFVIFFKIVFLVMVFAGTHGLFLLPVALSTWDTLSIRLKRRREVDERTQNIKPKEIEALIDNPNENDNQTKLSLQTDL